jgi:asparagine synthase (glutamine-hydrolysing)
MCGIAGIVNASLTGGAMERQLESMLPGIAPRGPDGVGRVVEAGVALLHTRLAIIDLETGQQPLWNEDRTIACIFNGELYNYRELRDELLGRGHVFATQSDTEVLVHLYEERAVELTSHVRGMYAFAIYDRPRSRVFIARDHLGIKPLFLANTEGGVAFASTIGALRAVMSSKELDREAMALYFQFGRVPEPRTAYESVRSLPPGHHAMIDVETAAVRVARHYCLPRVQGGVVRETRDPVSAARAAFEHAITSHLVADVEVAAFLSGGIDSSLVAAAAQRRMSRPLRTYCFGFPGKTLFDEARFAEVVATRLGTRHETVEVTASPRDLVRRGIEAVHQPFGVASFLPLLSLCEVAARDVKVVLSGDGGDEVALGYPWYRWMRNTQWVPRSRNPDATIRGLRALEREAAERGLTTGRRALKWARGVVMPRHLTADAWRYEMTPDESWSMLRADLRPPNGAPPSPGEEAWEVESQGVAALRRSDLQVSLRDEMLPKLDRAGMAFGLEGRVPLLDDDFVEAMLNIPIKVHLSDPRGKAILRQWAKEMVPGLDLQRPKHGFDVPIADWLRRELRDDVNRLLLDPRRKGLTDRAAAAGVWRRLEAGSPGAAHAAYAVLVAELWFESASL